MFVSSRACGLRARPTRPAPLILLCVQGGCGHVQRVPRRLAAGVPGASRAVACRVGCGQVQLAPRRCGRCVRSKRRARAHVSSHELRALLFPCASISQDFIKDAEAMCSKKQDDAADENKGAERPSGKGKHGAGKGANSDGAMVCYYCWKPGHKASECWLKKRKLADGEKGEEGSDKKKSKGKGRKQ